MTVKLLLLLLTFLSTGYSLWQSSVEHGAEHLDSHLAKNLQLIVEELNKCVPWKESPFTVHEIRRKLGKHLKKHYEALRMDLLTEALPEEYDSLEACLHHVHHHIKRYHKALKRVHELERESTLKSLLSEDQISQLKTTFENTDSVDAVEGELHNVFKHMPKSFVEKKLVPQMIRELELTAKRKGRSIDEFVDARSYFTSHEVADSLRTHPRSEEHPRPLNGQQLAWMGDKEKSIVQRSKDNGATKWDVLNKIGELFFRARKEDRQKSIESLRTYCTENIENLIGDDKFKLLQEMHADSATVDKIETKFHEIVGQLPIEGDRSKAEHYGQFCRKVFRLVHFEPTDLTSWLTAKQRFLIGEMIQDSSIGDADVYEKMFDFYNSTTGAQREEAQEVIEGGCKWFIDHIFGEDIAEDIEELRFNATVTRQQLAAQLAYHAAQIESASSRKQVTDSLPICTRIYIGYDYSCECNGHSTVCDSNMHSCINCTGNTYGVQCEKCMDDFVRDKRTNECVAEEVKEEEEEEEEGNEGQKCECNAHSSRCDADGKCSECDHNTTGEQCEICKHGFYGDAQAGTADDCTACPCPNGGACRVNGSGLVECLECPEGTKGITCEKKDSDSSDSEERIAKRSHRRTGRHQRH